LDTYLLEGEPHYFLATPHSSTFLRHAAAAPPKLRKPSGTITDLEGYSRPPLDAPKPVLWLRQNQVRISSNRLAMRIVVDSPLVHGQFQAVLQRWEGTATGCTVASQPSGELTDCILAKWLKLGVLNFAAMRTAD